MAKVLLQEAPEDEIVAGPPPAHGTAPMPPVLPATSRVRAPNMEAVLEQAGAFFDDEQGRWLREVPDPRVAQELVLRGKKRMLAVTYTTRFVATGPDWRTALAVAQADTDGLTDAYVPGRGWVRAGRKPETERPENLGQVARMGMPTKIRYVEAPDDPAEQIKAQALVSAANAARGEGAAAVED